MRPSVAFFVGAWPDSALGLQIGFFHPFSRAFRRARLALAHPSFVTWRPRPTASAPAGTSFVMHEPAPI